MSQRKTPSKLYIIAGSVIGLFGLTAWTLIWSTLFMLWSRSGQTHLGFSMSMALPFCALQLAAFLGRDQNAEEWWLKLRRLGYICLGSLAFLIPLTLVSRVLVALFPSSQLLLSVLVPMIAMGSVIASLWFARSGPFLTETTIVLPNLPKAFDGYKIVQISDLHIGLTVREDYVSKVVKLVEQSHADAVVLTGDMSDGLPADLGELMKPICSLRQHDGIYFVTGNHEYYSSAQEWVEYFSENGVNVLQNSSSVIVRGDASLEIGGVNDHHAHQVVKEDRSSVADAFRGDKFTTRILLAHQPLTIDKAVQYQVDLQLSGHTHGGQIFPFNFLVKLQQPFVYGLDRREDTQIYTSSGTGFWGPPMRLGAPAEVALLTLQSTN